MRELKRSLDRASPGTGPQLHATYGITGVPMQSIIYNRFISDTYKFHGVTTGNAMEEMPFIKRASYFYKTKLYPGIAWCFVRECCATGGGIAIGPYANEAFVEAIGNNDYPRLYKFGSGLACGAMTAFLTQWIHNTALKAGAMAELGKEKPTTIAAFRRVFAEQGFSMVYRNYPQRMLLISIASAVLNMCDIFRDL